MLRLTLGVVFKFVEKQITIAENLDLGKVFKIKGKQVGDRSENSIFRKYCEMTKVLMFWKHVFSIL